MTRPNLRRRRFLQLGATAAAAGTAVSCNHERSPWRFLTVEEACTLEAVCERIVPADQDPGARAAGVVTFIDRQLVGFHKPFQPDYRRGLSGVDQSSAALFGARFADLAADRQTAVLTAMEKNKAPGEIWKQTPARGFFDTVLAHTMQGFYGDPRHGGNRDYASWRMLGIPHPPVRGRAHYDFTKKG
jgi:gluconate 2-dehydrogenase gamma chain